MCKATILVLAFMAFAELCSSTVIPVPPNEQTIQGKWVGVPYERNDYCRLVLTNNQGSFARVFELEQPMLYNVEAYKTDRQGGIAFTLTAVSTNAYPIRMSGKAIHNNELRIEVGSPDGGWAHKCVLYREDTVVRMLQILEESMTQTNRMKKQEGERGQKR